MKLPKEFLERMEKMLGAEYEAFLKSYENAAEIWTQGEHGKDQRGEISGAGSVSSDTDPVDPEWILL